MLSVTMLKDTIVPVGMISDKRMKSGLILSGTVACAVEANGVETSKLGRQRVRLALRRTCGGRNTLGLNPVFNPVDDGLEAGTV
jgi:hypothetical protein